MQKRGLICCEVQQSQGFSSLPLEEVLGAGVVENPSLPIRRVLQHCLKDEVTSVTAIKILLKKAPERECLKFVLG